MCLSEIHSYLEIWYPSSGNTKERGVKSARVEVGRRKERAEGKEEGRDFTQEVTPKLESICIAETARRGLSR